MLPADVRVDPGRLQRMMALERANQVRSARVELKRRIACGETTVINVLDRPPMETATMAIGELLVAQRSWGKRRMQKFLARSELLETKTVGSLTARQSALLRGQLMIG